MFKKTKKVFLDYASTTPTDKKVVSSMLPFFTKNFANPSALYDEGLDTRVIINEARQKVARITQTKEDEVIFTGSGTESDNLGIIGVARAVAKKAKIETPHIITTEIEHVAVLQACRQLETERFEVTYLPVDENGLVSAKDVVAEMRPETILVSVMLANNEIGTVLPVRQIGVEISRYKKEAGRIVSDFPYLHCDASQAPNYLNINVDRLGVDLLTLDSSKIYGPKGVGCLIKKSYVPAESILYGGGQEDGLRPGTENVAGIIGFVHALEITTEMQELESDRLSKLQEYFIEKITKEIPTAQLNGSLKNRLPNNVNICISGLNAEFAVIQLNELGICCAAMTACKNLSGEISSYVVKSLGNGCEKSSLRLTMGRDTVKKDIDKAVAAIKEIILAQGLK